MSAVDLGYLLAFLSAATGALRYNLAVFADSRGFDPIPFLIGALAVGTVCSGVHVVAREGVGGLHPIRRRTGPALLYGFLMAWSTLSHFLALRYLDATVMTSLSQTSILLTVALAFWLLRERLTGREWIGALLILAGLFLFRPWEGEAKLTGFLILLTGILGGSLATIGAKRWVAGVPAQVLMLWRNMVALVFVTAFHLVTRPEWRMETGTALACIGAGVLGPYLHGLFFLQALGHIEAAKASLMNRVQPVIVFVVSWIFLGTTPEGEDLKSAALVILGAAWLTATRSRTKRKPPSS